MSRKSGFWLHDDWSYVCLKADSNSFLWLFSTMSVGISLVKKTVTTKMGPLAEVEVHTASDSRLFRLQLPTSLRRRAEAIAVQQGISLDQLFILAVDERLRE